MKNGNYEILISHEVSDTEFKIDNGKFLSIDLGVSNLMTCYDNHNEKSFIVSGKQWLTINRYFDKKTTHYQSISDAQQSARGIKHPKKSKRVKRLYEKRRGQLNHLIHCATKGIANYCRVNDISKVIIGDMKGIRENCNLGKVNNQKFHKLPFKQIEDRIIYKLQLIGVAVEKQRENYSSQCSPLSASVSKEHAQKSNRKYRGLYKDNSTIFNADSVGAFNIMRLYLQSLKKEVKIRAAGLSNPTTLKFNQQIKYLCNPLG